MEIKLRSTNLNNRQLHDLSLLIDALNHYNISLIVNRPTQDVRPTIQLIDYGCSIDMKLLPENTTFTQVIKTEDFTCIEMQTGRPWTYQTDLYCLAATSHCLLFGNYMRVSNIGGRWFISSKLPRYVSESIQQGDNCDFLRIIHLWS